MENLLYIIMYACVFVEVIEGGRRKGPPSSW